MWVETETRRPSDNHLEGKIFLMCIHVLIFNKKGGYQMSYCASCDLHSNNTVIGILDEKGKKIYQKRVPNDLNLILGFVPK
jgi:hypothetical protein